MVRRLRWALQGSRLVLECSQDFCRSGMLTVACSEKRSALAVQALNLLVNIKSCFFGANESGMNFGMTKSSKHNHVADMSQSLVLNEQEAAMRQCEVIVFSLIS